MSVRIIVLESVSVWFPALQWELASAEIEMIRCDKVRKLDELLADHDSAVIVWDVATDTTAMLNWLGDQGRQGQVAIIACPGREHQDLEWSVRGCGVVSWQSPETGPFQLASVCRQICNLPQTA